MAKLPFGYSSLEPRYERSIPNNTFNDVDAIPNAMPIMIARFPVVVNTCMM